MNIKVRYSGSDYVITLSHESTNLPPTVLDLKVSISKIIGLDIDRQKLIWKGKVLRDEDEIKPEFKRVALFEIKIPVNLNERRPCIGSGCIFYGSYLTKWYCSQCYSIRDNNRSDNLSQIESPDNIDHDKIQDTPDPVDTGLCFKCNRNVGLLGFKCRCGYIYCKIHRNFTTHDCSYNWKEWDQQNLEKNLQGYENSKIDKI